MEKEENAWKAHVLVLPFSAQGHINPMLQFSKRLSSKGVKVTLAIPCFIAKSMKPKSGAVTIEPFSDGSDEGGMLQAGSFEVYFERLEVVGSISLSKLIEKYNGTKYPIKCLIYDSFTPWGLDLAKRHGLFGAPFFTQTCAVNAIYYHLHRGLLTIPVKGPIVSTPGLPVLELNELPTYVIDTESYPRMLPYFLNQFSKVNEVDWIFFNTFDKLEDEVVTWMEKQWPRRIMTIGPTVQSIYQDYRVKGDKRNVLNLFKDGLNLSTANLDTCMEWLNTKQTRSVIYVSLGTIAKLGAEQMEELMSGLMRRSNNYYLWVIARVEVDTKFTFTEEMLEKGLVVKWCPQLEVLAHPSIGCFITHCGWNSTLEALCLGVPMVAMPNFADQTTNAKFVEDVWRVGIKAKKDEKGIVRRDEIDGCIREVMNGEKGEEIKTNLKRWKVLLKEATSGGGSSDKNIEEFVARIVCTSS